MKEIHADGYVQPERKKSKAEVMSEVIAKSKEYKVSRRRSIALRSCLQWWRRRL